MNTARSAGNVHLRKQIQSVLSYAKRENDIGDFLRGAESWSINISKAHLRDTTLMADLNKVFRANPKLVIEITEHGGVLDGDALAGLKTLRKGISKDRISLDDLGSTTHPWTLDEAAWMQTIGRETKLDPELLYADPLGAPSALSARAIISKALSVGFGPSSGVKVVVESGGKVVDEFPGVAAAGRENVTGALQAMGVPLNRNYFQSYATTLEKFDQEVFLADF
jgi:hypothetical protein